MRTTTTVFVCFAALVAATANAQAQIEGVKALEEQDPDANAGKREYAEVLRYIFAPISV